jgi:hypothetical protein
LKKTLPTLAVVASAIVILIGMACNKSSSSSSATTTNNNIPADQIVTASLQGRVVDENGLPIQGAAVTSGSASTTTDVNGIFSFTSISMSSRFGYVKVVESGYYTGSRSIITNPGSANFVSIQLVPLAAASTFPAASGGSIAIASGDTATFPANGVVTASTNAAYTGTVHVYTNYLNPLDPNLYKYMPGDLRGIGSNGLETALETYGIVAVELQDAAGNQLQLAKGQTATLTFPIPDTLQSSAPATIPLWYFNDTTGRWIQQGAAIRMGNSYVGQVSHFTYWSIDVPVTTVNFNVRLKDQYGNPIPYTRIYFTGSDYQLGFNVNSFYTDSSGYAQGLIVKGESLVMQVVTQCGNVLAGANVGPALQDQNLGTIVVNINYADLNLSGKVVNCSSSPVDSGYVNATVDGLNYRAVVRNGAFTLPILRCNNTSTQVKLIAYDFTQLVSSAAASISVTSGNVVADTLIVCGGTTSGGTPAPTYNQFLSFSTQGVTGTYTNPPDTVTMAYDTQDNFNFYAIDFVNGTQNSIVTFTLQNFHGLGSYPIYYLQYQNNGTSQTLNSIGGTCTITQYDAVGGYIAGSLSGNLSSASAPGQASYPLTGSFKFIRTE